MTKTEYLNKLANMTKGELDDLIESELDDLEYFSNLVYDLEEDLAIAKDTVKKVKNSISQIREQIGSLVALKDLESFIYPVGE